MEIREKSHLGNCAERDEMALRYFKRFENWRMSEEIEDKYFFFMEREIAFFRAKCIISCRYSVTGTCFV